ncbi:hypothetical protein A966_01838 [Brachyspira hampsonii 30446]|uniref:Uncharacterized protein n=3 Tax=Brachyspira hampsonii TaxID=1287055 RepID=A0A2U4F1C7_9SPIR|nr:hypothetical protein [Brachyspira hampsonii]EKV58112.1 hypothetical protein A966_01838 [Brachyspira hampsonii 30446]OEJ19949.1 hypothetical protein A9495_02930 [Brachyspira hampsonii]
MSEKKFKKFNNNNNFNNNKENNKKFFGKKNKTKFYKKKYNNQYNKYQEKSIEEYEKNYLKKRMKEEVERPICPICNEPIYIIEEAIRHNASGELAHFECILNEIKDNNIADMEEEDKIVYLGSGTFGIIQERQNGKNTRFFVRKRINYENRKVKKIEDDSDPEEEDLFNV